MHLTFYIMFFHAPHILHPFLYYSCTPISPCFCNLHPTLGTKFKVSYILKHIYFTQAIFTNQNTSLFKTYILTRSLPLQNSTVRQAIYFSFFLFSFLHLFFISSPTPIIMNKITNFMLRILTIIFIPHIFI